MIDGLRPGPPRGPRRCDAIVLGWLSILTMMWALPAQAQPKTAGPAPAAVRAATAPKPGTGPAWSDLTPSQQAALKPLHNEWASLDEPRKRKWLQIAQRYPALSAPDQARLRARMAQWARMTPQERGKVRLQFLEAKKMPATARQAEWQAYQALSPDERKALAARAPTAPHAAAKAAEPAPHSATPRHSATRAGAGIAHTAASAPSAKPATSTIVRAAPGATTILITKQRAPAAHQRTGGAKITASPDVVDKSTLLPRAGAQSPRARPSADSTPAARP